MRVGGERPDEPEINLIPLIDVLFCLILFLVLTTSFNQRAALHLQLPQAQAGVLPDERPPLVVIVDVEVIERHQVRVRDVGEVAKLAFQLVDGISIQTSQRFEGDDLIPNAVVDVVDDAHAAGADLPADDVSSRSSELNVVGNDLLERKRRDAQTADAERRVLIQRCRLLDSREQ